MLQAMYQIWHLCVWFTCRGCSVQKRYVCEPQPPKWDSGEELVNHTILACCSSVTDRYLILRAKHWWSI